MRSQTISVRSPEWSARRVIRSHSRTAVYQDECRPLAMSWRRLMKSIALKVLLGLGAAALIASLALMVWTGFAMSAYGG